MDIMYNDGNKEKIISLIKDEEGNPKWEKPNSDTNEINQSNDQEIELINILTQQSLLLGETDLDHPLANYRSPSNPNDYLLINHILVDLLQYELISPTIDDFIDDYPDDPDIVY